MLTSFFGKSTPTNFILLSIFILIGGFVSLFTSEITTIDFKSIALNIVAVALLIFQLLLLDFILRKNNLAVNSNYGIFFFTCMVLAFPSVYNNWEILVASTLLMLALRRIFSFSSERNKQKKILDASIYIALASFFYSYALLFLIVLYFSLVKRYKLELKSLFIPVIGFLGVFILLATFFYITTDSFYWLYNNNFFFDIDFTAYNQLVFLVPLTVLATLIVWASTSTIFAITRVSKKKKPNLYIILIAVFTTIAIVLCPVNRNGTEILFAIPTCAMLFSNYIENAKETKFKEVIAWVFVLLPVVVLWLHST